MNWCHGLFDRDGQTGIHVAFFTSWKVWDWNPSELYLEKRLNLQAVIRIAGEKFIIRKQAFCVDEMRVHVVDKTVKMDIWMKTDFQTKSVITDSFLNWLKSKSLVSWKKKSWAMHFRPRAMQEWMINKWFNFDLYGQFNFVQIKTAIFQSQLWPDVLLEKTSIALWRWKRSQSFDFYTEILLYKCNCRTNKSQQIPQLHSFFQ